MSGRISSSECDLQNVLSQLNCLWNDKDVEKINVQLESFFKHSLSLFLNCLDLVEFSKDKRKPNSLGNCIIDNFRRFLNRCSNNRNDISTDLKRRVLRITTFSHLSLSVKLIECFEVDKPSLLLIKQHIKNLIAVDKNFNAAISLVTALNLQDEFSILEVALPILLQNKLRLLEPYLKGSEKAQLEMFHLIDSWLIENFDFVSYFSNHNIRNVSEEVLRPQFQEKMLSKWLKMFGKENLAEEICPNMCRRRSMSAVRYILYRYYTENTATFENTTDLVVKLIGTNEWLQDRLLQLLQYTYQDYEAMDTFNELFGRKLHHPKYLDPAHFYEEEDWGSDLSRAETSAVLVSRGQNKATRKNWHAENHQIHHSLSLSLNLVIFIDSIESLEHCIDLVLNSDIVGIDAEWLFMQGLTSEKSVALLQLATRTRVFLIDFLMFCRDVSYTKKLGEFLNELFESTTVIKVGFGLNDDLKKISICLGMKEILTRHACRVLDLHVVSKHIGRHYPKLLSTSSPPSSQVTGLSKLVLQTVGLTLDKSEQISDWERRPLREAQIKYAALDAYCLLEIYDILSSRLSATNNDLTLENVVKLKPISVQNNAIERGCGRSTSKNFPEVIEKKPITSVSSFKVVCDNMLQGLGKQLRCCGIDTVILNNLDRHDVAAKTALKEKRIILTAGAPFQSLSSHVPVGSCLDVPIDRKAKDQLKFVLDHYNVHVQPCDVFSRCHMCNCGKYLVVSAADMLKLISHHGKVPRNPASVPWEKFRNQATTSYSARYNADFDDDDDDDDENFFIVDGLDDTLKKVASSIDKTVSYHASSKPNKTKPKFSSVPQSSVSSLPNRELYPINPNSLSSSSFLDIDTGQIASSDQTTGAARYTSVLYQQVPKPICDQVREFYCCIDCGKVYWDGQHFGSAMTKFDDIIKK